MGKLMNDNKELYTTTILPTKEEIDAHKSYLIGRYSTDEMVDIADWDGSCFKKLFELLTEYADKIDCDPWDVFAITIKRIYDS